MLQLKCDRASCLGLSENPLDPCARRLIAATSFCNRHRRLNVRSVETHIYRNPFVLRLWEEKLSIVINSNALFSSLSMHHQHPS